MQLTNSTIFNKFKCMSCVNINAEHFIYSQVLDIVRAAESLALGAHLQDTNANVEHVSHPPLSRSPEHEDKMQKTTTIVMSAHTLDTQPQVRLQFYALPDSRMLFNFSFECNP